MFFQRPELVDGGRLVRWKEWNTIECTNEYLSCFSSVDQTSKKRDLEDGEYDSTTVYTHVLAYYHVIVYAFRRSVISDLSGT